MVQGTPLWLEAAHYRYFAAVYRMEAARIKAEGRYWPAVELERSADAADAKAKAIEERLAENVVQLRRA